MNLSYQQIRYIISLAEHQHFGRAAKACFVTQPTLSMQVKKAEDALGFLLFNRDRNPLELTEYGSKILPVLYEMQADFSEIMRITNESKGIVKEELRIGIIPTIAAYLVPELFANQNAFSSKISWAIKELKSAEIIDALDRKSIDVGIMAGPVHSENLLVTPLYNEEILAFIPKLKGKRIAVEALQQEQPWLLNEGNCLRTQMIHFCELQDQKTSTWNYEGGNLEMLVKMVRNYGGYTLIPDFYRGIYDMPPGSLKHIYRDESEIFPARNVIALHSHKNQKHPDLAALIRFIKVNFSNKKETKFEILNWNK